MSGRQVDIPNLTASDLRSSLEMQMRSYDWAAADRVPVAEQDLCEFSVKDSIVIAHNINLPSIARQAGLNNTIILLQPEHESRRAAEFESIREIRRNFPCFLLILKLPLRNNLRWLRRTLHSARHLFQQNRRQGLRHAFAAVGHAFDMEGLQTRQ